MLVSVVSLLAAASIVSAQSNAPVTTNNPAGAKYVATLPKKAGSNLSGYIEGASGENGKGVRFNVHFDGLPSTGGPFMYHIHAKPVPADGNCTATGAHLDPYHYGEDKSCDASKPEICQTGDLSGKYGTFDGNSFSASYLDPYSSTSPSDPAFFGSVSFVLHLHNKTRIGCANFQLVSGGDNNNNGYPAGGYPTGGYPTGGQVSTPGAIQSTPLPSTLVSSGGAAAPTGYTPGYPAGNPPTYPANNATVGVPSPTAGVPIIPSGSPSPTVPSQFTGAASKLASGAGALAAAAAAAFIL